MSRAFPRHGCLEFLSPTRYSKRTAIIIKHLKHFVFCFGEENVAWKTPELLFFLFLFLPSRKVFILLFRITSDRGVKE